MKKIDILFINPGNRLEQFAKLNELATVAQPLGLAMLAAFIRNNGYTVAIIDAEAEFWTPEEAIIEIEKYEPILIGISAFTTKMTASGKILKLIKEKMPDVKTCIGGHHASAIPERTLREEAVDYVIVGEGYWPILHLLDYLKNNKPFLDKLGISYLESDKFIFNGRSDGIVDLDTMPIAAWDLLPMNKYRAHHWQAWNHKNLDQSGFALVYTSLGCPFDCEFCSVNVVYGNRKMRYKSPEKVVEEIEYLYNNFGVKYIEIIDDTFTINYKKTEHLCDVMIEHDLGSKIEAWCFSRTDRTDKNLLTKMKKAGINWVFMGLESGSDLVLKGVNKHQTKEQIKIAINKVRDAGIFIGGNYIFGLPSDTKESMQETIDSAIENNTEYANFFIPMAYPGTKLHEIAKQKHYKLPDKWGQYGFFAPDAVPMRNENLSAEDILDFRDKAFETYFNNEKYQNLILNIYGKNTLDFINTKVLSKKIYRVHRN